MTVRRAAALPLGAAAVALAAWSSWSLVHSPWVDVGNGYDHVLVGLVIVTLWVFPIAAGIVWRRRPWSRLGPLILLLGAFWAAWAGLGPLGSTGTWFAKWLVLAVGPLAFWLLLAWPVGRLRRADAWWLGAYTAAISVTLGVVPVCFDPLWAYGWNPLLVADLPDVVAAASSFGTSIVVPVGATVVLATVARRFGRLPAASRWLARPILVAAVVLAVADVQQGLGKYLELSDAAGRPNAAGFLSLAISYSCFAGAALLVVVAVDRAARQRLDVEAVRRIDLPDRVAATLRSSIVGALDDATAAVAFWRSDGAWVASDGAEVNLGGPGRSVAVVADHAGPIAAVELDERVADRPTVVEIAVAAVGASIEHERLEALANARRDEAARARRTIVEAHDASRARVERDLHDGAQQRLVALALFSRLSAQRASEPTGDTESVADDLRRGIDAVRAGLRDVAAGTLSEQIAARGLDSAIATIAATSPIAIDVDVHQPPGLSAGVAATVWFVVAEAVANAAKHAGAHRLRVEGSATGDRFTVTVTDDGSGGATPRAGGGLDGLDERVQRAGGTFRVDSPRGGGTAVVAAFPVGAPP